MEETLIRGKTAVCDPDQIHHLVVSLVFEAEVFGDAVVYDREMTVASPNADGCV
jgi:hypothetical protein